MEWDMMIHSWGKHIFGSIAGLNFGRIMGWNNNVFTNENHSHSYEATIKAVAKKAQKKFWGFNGIWTHDLCDTSAIALPTELWSLIRSRSRAS